MREDQYNKLADLQEKLCDVILYEADPDNWPGSGKPLKDLSQGERGDRYWSKKNAAATLTLLNKVVSIGTRTNLDTGGNKDDKPEDDIDLDRQMRKAEQEAAKILKRFQERHAE